MRRPTITGLLLAGAIGIASNAFGNSILNGGFETGSFAEWTVDRAESGSLLFLGGRAHSGTKAAWFGAIGSLDDVLSQTLTTEPGHSYVVAFWLAHGATDASNAFSVWWDTTPLLMLDHAMRFAGTEYVYSVPATGESTVLRFEGRELRDYYYLDDVSVTPVSNPEPGTLILVGLGAAALVRARRRR